MTKLRFFLDEIFIHRGFSGAGDYFATVFGLKTLPFFNVQVIGLALSTLAAFATNWIWNPPGAVLLLIGQDLINMVYGYLANKKTKGDKWSWLKFQRTWSIIASDIISCAMLHIAIKYYPYYENLADVLFGWLFSFKLRAIFTHFTLLGYQPGTLGKFFIPAMKNLLRSKFGEELIEGIQKDKEHEQNTNTRSSQAGSEGAGI